MSNLKFPPYLLYSETVKKLLPRSVGTARISSLILTGREDPTGGSRTTQSKAARGSITGLVKAEFTGQKQSSSCWSVVIRQIFTTTSRVSRVELIQGRKDSVEITLKPDIVMQNISAMIKLGGVTASLGRSRLIGPIKALMITQLFYIPFSWKWKIRNGTGFLA